MQLFTFLGYTAKVTYDVVGQEEYKQNFRLLIEQIPYVDLS
jgi:hypothetical protein